MTPPGPAEDVEVKQFKTADDFVETLSRASADCEPPDYRSPWVFRGHNDACWPLQPAAWRPDGQKKLGPLIEWLRPKITETLPQFPNYQNARPDIRQLWFDYLLPTIAEIFAVRQFCDLADELGLELLDSEQVLDFPELISVSTFFGLLLQIFGDPIAAFPHLPFAYAQHHGIPTRFLDWTRDPLVAAFFAADLAGPIDPARQPATNICVWATRCDQPIRGTIEWVTVPRSRHHFLHAQNGLFSFNRYAREFFMHNDGRWPTFQDGIWPLPGGQPSSAALRQFLLPADQSRTVLQLLFERRNSRAHLMTVFDNVAVATRERWRWLSAAPPSPQADPP